VVESKRRQIRHGTLVGVVSKKLYAEGSKSERQAVVLVTDDKTTFLLRRLDGNPFQDSVLDQLVGKNISGRGVIYGTTFILDNWEVVN
jgi:hypothetical protein